MPVSGSKFYSAQILSRSDISEDLWKIRVNPGGDFSFKAGQYATLGVVTPEKHIERAYSIVSAPHEEFMEFFIELVPQGALTPLLYKAQVGDQITMRKSAKGTFMLNRSGRFVNHLLIATVTGIAPYVSYVRSLYRDWKAGEFEGPHRLFLLEGASRPWELGYSAELAKVASEVPWLTYVCTISRPWEDAEWKGETGRVDELVRKYSDMWNLKPEDTEVCLCGHPDMIENVKGIAKRHGWQQDAVRAEAYFVPPKS